MALPATDDFAGTGALSANWTAIEGGGQRNGGTLSTFTGGFNNSEYWNADTPGNDQYAQLTHNTMGDGGAFVRGSVGNSFYVPICQSGQTHIQKNITGSFTTLATRTNIAAGSVVRITAVGTTIDVLDDGVSIGSVTDSSLTSGFGGWFQYQSGAVYDNFEVGNLSGAAFVPQANLMLIPQAVNRSNTY